MVTTTKYVWDPVFDCVTHELDENNAVKAVYHNEPQQYGGVLSQRRGGTSHYHHHDALGSTRFLTDSTGNVTDTYLNDAWGNSVETTGTTVNPFRWVGKYGYYTDSSTGQVYVRARMYQPTVARWTTFDPIYPFLWMDYQYCGNHAVAHVDSSGLLSSIEVDRKSEACGTYRWHERWQFSPAERDGIVLQYVCFKADVVICPNAACAKAEATFGDATCRNKQKCNEIDFNDRSFPLRLDFCYWEAWRIVDGKMLVWEAGDGSLMSDENQLRQGRIELDPDDTFGFPMCSNALKDGCTCGSAEQLGTAYFIPLPLPRGTPSARGLLSKLTRGRGGVQAACDLHSTCVRGHGQRAHWVIWGDLVNLRISD